MQPLLLLLFAGEQRRHFVYVVSCVFRFRNHFNTAKPRQISMGLHWGLIESFPGCMSLFRFYEHPLTQFPCSKICKLTWASLYCPEHFFRPSLRRPVFNVLNSKKENSGGNNGLNNSQIGFRTHSMWMQTTQLGC